MGEHHAVRPAASKSTENLCEAKNHEDWCASATPCAYGDPASYCLGHEVPFHVAATNEFIRCFGRVPDEFEVGALWIGRDVARAATKEKS